MRGQEIRLSFQSFTDTLFFHFDIDSQSFSPPLRRCFDAFAARHFIIFHSTDAASMAFQHCAFSAYSLAHYISFIHRPPARRLLLRFLRHILIFTCFQIISLFRGMSHPAMLPPMPPKTSAHGRTPPARRYRAAACAAFYHAAARCCRRHAAINEEPSPQMRVHTAQRLTRAAYERPTCLAKKDRTGVSLRHTQPPVRPLLLTFQRIDDIIDAFILPPDAIFAAAPFAPPDAILMLLADIPD
jgi:hypothetical protein